MYDVQLTESAAWTDRLKFECHVKVTLPSLSRRDVSGSCDVPSGAESLGRVAQPEDDRKEERAKAVTPAAVYVITDIARTPDALTSRVHL